MIRTFTCRWAALKGSKPCWEVSMARSSWCTLAEAFSDFVCMAAWLPKFVKGQFTPKHWSYSIYSTDLWRYKHTKIYDLFKVCQVKLASEAGIIFQLPTSFFLEIKPMLKRMVNFWGISNLSKNRDWLRVFSVDHFSDGPHDLLQFFMHSGEMWPTVSCTKFISRNYYGYIIYGIFLKA